MYDKFNYRQQTITYDWNWLDDDTFVFQFGDGEFTDSDGDDYFIHFEYHVKDNEWVITIWWDDDSIAIEKLKNHDEYITETEIEKVKQFARQFM